MIVQLLFNTKRLGIPTSHMDNTMHNMINTSPFEVCLIFLPTNPLVILGLILDATRMEDIVRV